VHSLHWFPGNFIPQIPAFLIQALSASGGLIVDPFCGSGTTGAEALLLDRNCWQGDMNRVSGLIATAKIVLLTDPAARMGLAEVMDPLYWGLRPPCPASKEIGKEGMHPELLDWYHPDTLEQLLRFGLASRVSAMRQ
jgi:DNA methylase